jgi:hypothetical protein
MGASLSTTSFGTSLTRAPQSPYKTHFVDSHLARGAYRSRIITYLAQSAFAQGDPRAWRRHAAVGEQLRSGSTSRARPSTTAARCARRRAPPARRTAPGAGARGRAACSSPSRRAAVPGRGRGRRRAPGRRRGPCRRAAPGPCSSARGRPAGAGAGGGCALPLVTGLSAGHRQPAGWPAARSRPARSSRGARRCRR